MQHGGTPQHKQVLILCDIKSAGEMPYKQFGFIVLFLQMCISTDIDHFILKKMDKASKYDQLISL